MAAQLARLRVQSFIIEFANFLAKRQHGVSPRVTIMKLSHLRRLAVL